MSGMKLIPSVYAESVYLLNGKPFRLTNRRYLDPIYNADIKDGIIMSGRQVEKSTTASTMIANYTTLISNFNALYFAPLTDQVDEFSNNRLGKLYKYSQNDYIKSNFLGRAYKDNVHYKEFANGSVNYLRHCFEYGDNIRGISVNGIWGDEIQDIHIDALPVIKETQSHALESGCGMKITWYTGTPKTFSNTIQQYWDKSTQNEWVVKCPHCNYPQILGLKNLTPTKFICAKCGEEIPNEARINGIWVKLQPGNKIEGFRISQTMVPWITAEDIWDKYTTYSTAKFYNEVLGRSYDNADKPFTMTMLNRICENEYRLYDRAKDVFANRPTFMGVDWGSGDNAYTVILIFGLNPDGKLQLIFAKRCDTGKETDVTWQTEYISQLMGIFRVKYCIVDIGYGQAQYEILRNRFGKRVASCYYSFNLGVDTKWNEKKQQWVVNRTRVIFDYAEAIGNCEIVWAGRDRNQYEWLFDNHLVENAEYRKNKNGKSEDLMYNHPEGQPDDGLHAGVYAHLAYKLSQNNLASNIKFSGVHIPS